MCRSRLVGLSCGIKPETSEALADTLLRTGPIQVIISGLYGNQYVIAIQCCFILFYFCPADCSLADDIRYNRNRSASSVKFHGRQWTCLIRIFLLIEFYLSVRATQHDVGLGMNI